jgi:hypothetical protein
MICPRLIKRAPDINKFVSDTLLARDRAVVIAALREADEYLSGINFKRLTEEQKKLLNNLHSKSQRQSTVMRSDIVDDTIADALRLYHNVVNHPHGRIIEIVAVTAGIGYILWFYPILDLLIKVFAATFLKS